MNSGGSEDSGALSNAVASAVPAVLDAEESLCLLYVGLARARSGLVFAMRKQSSKGGSQLKAAWLDELTDAEGNPVIVWPAKSGPHTAVAAGRSTLCSGRLRLHARSLIKRGCRLLQPPRGDRATGC